LQYYSVHFVASVVIEDVGVLLETDLQDYYPKREDLGFLDVYQGLEIILSELAEE